MLRFFPNVFHPVYRSLCVWTEGLNMGFTSLQRLCLNRIAKDIAIWCSDGLNHDDMAECLYVLGPFDNLGSRQIQELLHILVSRKQLKTPYLHTLLHCGLTSLDLSTCSFLISNLTIKIIAKRCKKIVHLILQNCSRINSKTLQELTLGLSNLRSLDLSGCLQCNDHVLASLGKNCQNLHVLKLDSCKKVTDLGIKELCSGSTTLASCSKIVEISLLATGVSSEGVFHLLLTQSHLQSLSLSYCHQSPRQQTYFNDSYLALGTTKLKYVDLSNTSIGDSGVKNLCRICPSLSNLILTECHSLTGLCLDYLQALSNLKHLHLDGSCFDFERHLKPFLIKQGCHLETLHLPSSCSIDTHVIGQYCSNLTHLLLTDSSNLSGSYINKDDKTVTLLEACPHLKYLDLQHCTFSGSKPLSEHLSSIFCISICDLETLNLSGIENLEYESISKFVESPGFSKLTQINISQCPLVNKELVFLLLNSCKDNLQALDVSGCWKVNRSDIEAANQMMKASGCQIELTWT